MMTRIPKKMNLGIFERITPVFSGCTRGGGGGVGVPFGILEAGVGLMGSPKPG